MPDEGTVTISFDVTIGDEWIDPSGAVWRVAGHDTYHARLTRAVEAEVAYREMVRVWTRRLGGAA